MKEDIKSDNSDKENKSGISNQVDIPTGELQSKIQQCTVYISKGMHIDIIKNVVNQQQCRNDEIGEIEEDNESQKSEIRK